MNHEKLLNDIKSRAHWRVEIRPTRYDRLRMPSRKSMQELMKAAAVSFRGWPYPYYESSETGYTGTWLEGHIDWEEYKEYWRLYESGQWLHYFAVHSVRIPREILFANRRPLPPEHTGYIHVRDTLYTVTEMFRFAVAMAELNVLEPSAYISIELRNASNCMLFENSDRRFPFQYVSEWDTAISGEWLLAQGELRATADEAALEMAIKIFSVFGWTPTNAGTRSLSEDQTKLVERRLLVRDRRLDSVIGMVKRLTSSIDSTVGVEFETGQWFKEEVLYLRLRKGRRTRNIEITLEEGTNAEQDPALLRSRIEKAISALLTTS